MIHKHFGRLVSRLSSTIFAVAALAASLSSTAQAAGLTLTSAGAADGFTTSTFATIVPGNYGCCSGPFGVAVTNNGNVLVGDGLGTTYAFADIDGSAPLSSTAGGGVGVAYASVGGQAYGAECCNAGTPFVEFNNDGTINHVLSDVSQTAYRGMWGDPNTGLIYATSSEGIIAINPLANGGLGSSTVINGSLSDFDGLTVSPDGSTIYVEIDLGSGPTISAYSTSTGAFIQSFTGFNSPDGAAVISGGAYNGFLVVNNNDGSVDLVDPSNGNITNIANATVPGDRGDFVSPDVNNGTLFLTYGDSVERLGLTGADIGAGGSSTPEPSTLALFGIALGGLGLFRRARRK